MRQKILIIEDDKQLCEMIKFILTREGYNIEVSHNGKEAIHKLQSFTPHLIILDIMLPEINGWQIQELLRADSKTSRIPVIVLTSRNFIKDIDKAFSLGAAAYITKPFSIEKLVKKVKSLLQK